MDIGFVIGVWLAAAWALRSKLDPRQNGEARPVRSAAQRALELQRDSAPARELLQSLGNVNERQ